MANEQVRLFLPGEFESGFTEDVRWAIGLKPFVIKRNESVGQQLVAELPRTANGDGNIDLFCTHYTPSALENRWLTPFK